MSRGPFEQSLWVVATQKLPGDDPAFIGRVLIVSPPIEKGDLYQPFVGHVFEKIRAERDGWIFRHDSARRMSLVEKVRERGRLVPDRPISGQVDRRYYAWCQACELTVRCLAKRRVRKIFRNPIQRRRHPVERKPFVSHQRPELERIGRPDRPIKFVAFG